MGDRAFIRCDSTHTLGHLEPLAGHPASRRSRHLFDPEDEQGASYKVFGYEHLVQAPVSAGFQQQWEPTGVVEYKLASGEHLELESDGMLRVSASGLRLQRQ